MAKHILPRGMQVFVLIWFGQLVSLIGSGLTSFALGVWVYQGTGSTTRFALIYLFTALPALVMSPLAGALVDRWSRRWVMIFSDCGAALSTLIVALLFFANRLQVWHIYLTAVASSIFGACQWPAYSAMMSLLVPKQHLGRTNAMTEVGYAVAYIVSPVLASVLVAKIQIPGVILIDFATFFFAVATLLIFQIPEPEKSAEGKAGKGSLLREITHGFTYIFTRPGLRGLLLCFSAIVFAFAMGHVLLTPLVLSFASATVLGTVLSVAGGGGLVGGIIMSVWGGPKRRIYGVLGVGLLQGGLLCLAGLRANAPFIATVIFFWAIGVPIATGSCQAIWQTKVPPNMQGRVLSVQRMAGDMMRLLAYLVAGPLVDRVFEPFLATAGSSAKYIGQIIGVGPGRGIGLLGILVGMLLTLTMARSFLDPRLRSVEDELPDMIFESRALSNLNTKGQAQALDESVMP